MIKRLLIALLVLLLLVAVAVAALPWWWGAALRGPAEEQGVTFGDYERVGYGRWAINDVVVERPGLRLEIDRIEAPHPLALWGRGAEAGTIEVGSWHGSGRPPAQEDEASATRPDWDTLLAQFDAAARRLPPVQVAAGSWTWADGQTIRIGGADWDATGVRLASIGYADHVAHAEFAREARELRVVLEEPSAAVAARLAADGDTIDLEGTWQDHPVSGRIRFPDTGWMPAEAEASTGSWTLDGAEVGLAPHYGTVTASASLAWNGERFALEVQAAGEPAASAELPALEVDLQAEGSRTAVTLAALTVRMPGVEAQLDEPVQIALDAEAVSGARSQFRLRANLAELPWEGLQGQVRGLVEVTAQGTQWPHLAGELVMTEIVAGEWALEEAEVAGEFTWPTWRIHTAQARDAQGSEIDLAGEGNVQSKEFTVTASRLDVQRGSVEPWLPEGVAFESLSASGRAEGRWPNLRVNGEAAARGVTWSPLRPADIMAEFSPRDGGGTTVALVARTVEGNGSVQARGHWEGGDLTIEEAALRDGDERLLALVEPVRLAAGQKVVRDLRLAGALGEWRADLLSAAEGAVAVSARKLDTAWVQDWWAGLPEMLPRIDDLDASFGWTPESFEAAAALRAHLDLEKVGTVTGEARLTLDERGLLIERMQVGKADRRFASVTGRLPLALHRDGLQVVELDEQAPLSLEAMLAPNPDFWRAWGQLTGVTLVGPDVQVKLDGTWRRLRGNGQIRLARLELAERLGGVQWPVISNVQGRVAADGEGLRLEGLSAEIDNNLIRASGRLPLARADWEALSDDPLTYLRRRGEAQLDVSQAQLASVARLLPGYLVPTGTVDVSLHFGDGGKVNGTAALRGAVTRPIGPLGVLQEVNADLSFGGDTVRFESVTAMMGGQPLELDGAVEWRVGEEPRLDLHLQGSNVPLVRNTGVLLRGDLDLSLRTSREGSTTVAGAVTLRDGLMLADVRSLVPGGGERQSRRPPYFSVEVEPFSAWQLDVEVSGQRFLRMRTPVLNGVASIDARLEGTLLNPRAIGSVTLEEGSVKLPFANFQVEEAYARLSRASPYEPEIFLRGEGRRLGYDLTLELSGTASDPRLEMSSDPALPAAEVLLFVMAGVPPGDDASDLDTRQRSLKLGVYLGRELVGDLLGLEPSDKLTVTTGEQLSRRGKETYRFDYELNKRWTLTGEYDEFDYYNAGVRWRWYPWKNDEESAADDGEDAP